MDNGTTLFRISYCCLLLLVGDLSATIAEPPNVTELITKYYGRSNKIYICVCRPKAARQELVDAEKRFQIATDVTRPFGESYVSVDLSCGRSGRCLAQLEAKGRSGTSTNANCFSISDDGHYVARTGDSLFIADKPSLDGWTPNRGGETSDTMEASVKISFVVPDPALIEEQRLLPFNTFEDRNTKLNYELLHHLVFAGNFTETFRGTVAAMIDDLRSGHSDIAGAPIDLDNGAVDEFDILGKAPVPNNKFVFRATPHSYIKNVFTLPFDRYVWYSVCGLIAVIFLVTYAIVYWEWKDPVFRKHVMVRHSLEPDPVEIILMEIGSAAQQGFESEPRSNSGRIVFIFTLISLMFLYTSFSASIVALLQSTTDSLNSLENLLSSRIPVGFVDNTSMDYFRNLTFADNRKETYNKVSKPVHLPIRKGVEKMRSDFFAFYADTSEIYKYVNGWFTENEKCNLREIPFKNTNAEKWLLMRKRHPRKDSLKMGMARIEETGIRSREFRRMFTSKPICDSAGGNFESVGLADSYGAFLVMGTGLLISVLQLFLEKLCIRYVHKK